MGAAQEGHFPCLELLIKAGAHLNLQDLVGINWDTHAPIHKSHPNFRRFVVNIVYFALERPYNNQLSSHRY